MTIWFGGLEARLSFPLAHVIDAAMDLREVPTTPFERHPWEIARARFFARVVQEHQDPGRCVRILDVGAGDGYLAFELVRGLPHGSSVVCLDPNYTDERIAALAAGAPASVTFAREPSGASFDWLLMLDVIEHVPDDAGFLSRFVAERLARGGTALISVPAWQGLFTQHDVALGHYRRYRVEELTRTLARAGLTGVESGSLFFSLLLPRLVSKVVELGAGIRSVPDPENVPAQASTAAGSFGGGRLLAEIVTKVLEADVEVARALAARGVALPGLSAWALGRKS